MSIDQAHIMHNHDQRLTRHARTDGPIMSRMLKGLPDHIIFVQLHYLAARRKGKLSQILK